MSVVHLVGMQLDLGAGRRGTDMGPSALRLTKLARGLRNLGHEVRDTGNIEVPIGEVSDEADPRARYGEVIAAACRRLAEQTRAIAEGGGTPLVLGGDHSLSMGSIAGVAAALRARGERLGVIWVDAHGDSNTPETTPSGNVHGMPLAALLGHGPSMFTEIAGPPPAVEADRAVLVGARSLDRLERHNIRDWGVRAITMADIDRRGIAVAAEEAIEVAGRGASAFYVSVDMDAVDPSLAPGVGTPVRGGLTYREAHYLMEAIAASGRMAGMDLTEVNPSLDRANTTAELAAELALSAFGERIL